MGRGSWIVERTLLGVHIRKATGVTEYHEATSVETVLLQLARHGRRDLLEAFAGGQIAGAELVAGVVRFGVSLQLTAERAVALAPAVARWLERADLADRTVRDYTYAFQVLQRGRRGAVVADLPVLVAAYARRAKPVTFRRVKAAAQSFL